MKVLNFQLFVVATFLMRKKEKKLNENFQFCLEFMSLSSLSFF